MRHGFRVSQIVRAVRQGMRSARRAAGVRFCRTRRSFPTAVNTILVPIDFSRVTRRVIDHALKLARPIDARIVMMHAVPPSPIIATDLAPLAGSALLVTADVQKAAERHLRRIQRERHANGITLETFCTTGAPVAAIADQARKLGARYIVMGSHGHSAFHDLVAGSTTSGVLKRVRCPVVVVPAQTKGHARRTKRR